MRLAGIRPAASRTGEGSVPLYTRTSVCMPPAPGAPSLRQLAVVAVLEEVEVVATEGVGSGRLRRVVRRSREEDVSRLAGADVDGVRVIRAVPVGHVEARPRAEEGRVLADHRHPDPGELHRVLEVAEVGQPEQDPVAGVRLDERGDGLAVLHIVAVRVRRTDPLGRGRRTSLGSIVCGIDAAVECEVVRVVVGPDRLLDVAVVVVRTCSRPRSGGSRSGDRRRSTGVVVRPSVGCILPAGRRRSPVMPICTCSTSSKWQWYMYVPGLCGR